MSADCPTLFIAFYAVGFCMFACCGDGSIISVLLLLLIQLIAII